MAFSKILIERLFKNTSRISIPSLIDCRVSSSSIFVRTLRNSDSTKDFVSEQRNGGASRRCMHKNAFSKPEMSPELRYMPVGDKLMEKLRGMDIVKDRIRFDGLNVPVAVTKPEKEEEMVKFSVEDARKLLKLAQIETVKSKLRKIDKSWILKSELVHICSDVCSDLEEGKKFAKLLDDSGTIIVFGNVVFLRPDQVAQGIRALLPTPIATYENVQERREFELMAKQKAIIDRKAESLVRRELWCGLGYMVVQTAGFMRLTFWELSWDVMEPICFYVTSMYFMAGYTFFLRTAREPSFEGFYQSRFAAKQKKLMKMQNFDIARYNELQKFFDIGSSLASSPPPPPTSSTMLFDASNRAGCNT